MTLELKIPRRRLHHHVTNRNGHGALCGHPSFPVEEWEDQPIGLGPCARCQREVDRAEAEAHTEYDRRELQAWALANTDPEVLNLCRQVSPNLWILKNPTMEEACQE